MAILAAEVVARRNEIKYLVWRSGHFQVAATFITTTNKRPFAGLTWPFYNRLMAIGLFSGVSDPFGCIERGRG
jgi:hypothetical protein